MCIAATEGGALSPEPFVPKVCHRCNMSTAGAAIVSAPMADVCPESEAARLLPLLNKSDSSRGFRLFSVLGSRGAWSQQFTSLGLSFGLHSYESLACLPLIVGRNVNDRGASHL